MGGIVKDWGITIGGFEKIEGQPQATHLMCEEMPWYVYFIEKYLTNLCCLPIFYWAGKVYTLHDVSLPNWPRWFGDKEDGELYTPREYYGDLGSIIIEVTYHIHKWTWKRTKSWDVLVPWAVLKPYQDAKTIKWVEESFADHIQWEKEDAEKKANEVVDTLSPL